MKKTIFIIILMILSLMLFVNAETTYHNISLATAESTSFGAGPAILVKNNMTLLYINKTSLSSATRVILYNSTESQIGAELFTGDIANFTSSNIELKQGSIYYFIIDNVGANYNRYRNTASIGQNIFINRTDMDFIETCYSNAAPDCSVGFSGIDDWVYTLESITYTLMTISESLTPPQNFIEDVTNISYSTATFNGYATFGNCSDYDITFEYGSVANYESDNQSVTLTGNTSNSTQIDFYTDVTGLSYRTLYKVRNIFTCNDETSIGGIYESGFSQFITLGDVDIIASGTTQTAVSNNGISYTLGDELKLKDIYYNPNLAIYTAIDNNGTFYTSSDALTWENEFYSTCQSYTYDIDKGYLVACSDQGALYNDDLTGAFENGDLTIVANLNGFSDEYNYGFAKKWDKFYYVNTVGNVFTSSNGLNWTNTASIEAWSYGKVVYYNDDIGALFVSGSNTGSGIYSGFPTSTNLYYSLDGTTFTLLYNGAGGGLQDILYSIDDDVLIFTMYGSENYAAKVTDNLTNLTIIGMTTWSGSIKKIAYNNGKYILYYNDRTPTYTSEDLTTWNTTGLLETDNNRIYSSQTTDLFYLVSDSVYKYSQDGITWTSVISGLPSDSILYIFDGISEAVDYLDTYPAYDINDTGAKLWGEFYLNSCSQMDVYFQYGVNPSYTTTTPTTANSDTQLVTQITGLLSNTTYSYRTVADILSDYCNITENTTVYGNWEYFTTNATEIVTPPITGDVTLDAYIPNIKADVNESIILLYDDYFSNYTDVRVSFDFNGSTIILYEGESSANSYFNISVLNNGTFYIEINTLSESITDINARVFLGIDSVSDTFQLDINEDYTGVEYYFPPEFTFIDVEETSTTANFLITIDTIGNCSDSDFYLINYAFGGSQEPLLIRENITVAISFEYEKIGLSPSTLYSYTGLMQCNDDLSIYDTYTQFYTTLSSNTVIITPPEADNSDFSGLWDTFTGGSTKTKIFIGFVIVFGILFIGFKSAGENNINLGFFGIFILVILGMILVTAVGIMPPFVLILTIMSGIVGILLSNMLGGNNTQ